MTDRNQSYKLVNQRLDHLIAPDEDVVSAMSTIVCELHHTCAGFDWTGFYRVIRPQLLSVGPYQGHHGCLRIPFDQGVCGAAARTASTIVVPDVNAFPGHIACSSTTKSEIVVPVFDAKGMVVAVLDVDSNEAAAFTETDRTELEKIVARLSSLFDAPAKDIR